MFLMNKIRILMLIIQCVAGEPYLLRSYPSNSIVQESHSGTGPCLDPIKTFAFLQGADDQSLFHTECLHKSDESMLTCKLGLTDAASSLHLDKYPLDEIQILVLFVQEMPEKKVKSRVLDLCFIERLQKSLRELAICGYRPPATQGGGVTYLHILDVPALAIVASNVETLLISSR